jgi:hypothetical protein
VPREQKADKKCNHERGQRPHQPLTQFDKMIDKRRFGRFDPYLFISGLERYRLGHR